VASVDNICEGRDFDSTCVIDSLMGITCSPNTAGKTNTYGHVVVDSFVCPSSVHYPSISFVRNSVSKTEVKCRGVFKADGLWRS